MVKPKKRKLRLDCKIIRKPKVIKENWKSLEYMECGIDPGPESGVSWKGLLFDDAFNRKYLEVYWYDNNRILEIRKMVV